MKELNALIKLFDQFAHSKNYATAFSDILDYMMVPFKYYQNQEQQLATLSVFTGHEEKKLLVPILETIGLLSEDFQDPLGQLYELKISNGHNGQFFTPDPIASFIANCVLTGDLQDGQTVYDSACGSGRMLLAAAKVNRYLRFYGAEIDSVLCKVSVVNMLLNSLSGEIAHMNTLSNEFFNGYRMSTILKDGYHYPYYVEFSDPKESYIWLRALSKSNSNKFDTPMEITKSPLMSEGIQGNLFD